MNTIGPSALIVAILYFLSRWALATVEHAMAHPGKGRPEITWKLAWWLSIIVCLLSAASVHVWLLTQTVPTWGTFVFNALVFGGFLIGFIVSGHFDHKVRLGLRS
ncbi:MAG: hypothetical protein GY856_03365 [bacterium]|nr:hypothetical protein [bacterium]